MLIRKAAYADIEAVYGIERSSFDLPWSKASIEAEYHRDISEFYVAEFEGMIAGYVIIWQIVDEAEVLTIAVDENFRLKGVGKALLKYVLCNRYGAENVFWFLEVECDNIVAIDLYEKFGFIKNGLIKNYYGEGKHAFRMGRPKGLK